MFNSKYIVLSDVDGYIEKMFIFDSTIQHKHIADLMKPLNYPKVVSAGFIDEFIKCYGESLTLSVKSRNKIDTQMLHRMLKINDKRVVFKD